MSNNLDYDIDAERVVLMNLIQVHHIARDVALYNTVVLEHFTDLFHRDVYSVAIDHFRKHYCMPNSVEKMARLTIQNMTRAEEKFKTRREQAKVWLNGVNRLYRKLKTSEANRFSSDMEQLEALRQTRVTKSFLMDASGMAEQGKSGEIIHAVNDLILSLQDATENSIMEGNLIDDFAQHIQLLKSQKAGDIRPVPWFIEGATESAETGEVQMVRLDSLVSGGNYPAELTLILGENNVGKSFLLMEGAYNAATVAHVNSALVTIEMNKIKAQRRAYARLTGIPYKKFKMGTLTKQDIAIWMAALQKWKKSKWGIMEFISMDGATVPGIMTKLRESSLKYGIPGFELISIDYLNDISPVGRYKSDKSWDAMGEISWSLARESKAYMNHKGVPILTANQKKTTSASNERTSWKDAGYGTIVTQHATVGIGMNQDETDAELRRIKIDIFKARDDDKQVPPFYVYPDFTRSMLSSKKRLREFYQMTDDDEEQLG